MPLPSNPTAILEVELVQVYLETARCVSTELMREVDKTQQGKMTQEAKVDWGFAVSFSLTSIAVLYSYLAVEAFANGNLYNLWQHARRLHKAGRLDKKPAGSATELRAFCERFGPYENFKLVCDKEKKMRELPNRLKTLCRVWKMPPLHEAEPQLWQDFLNLTQDHRHFLVHPYPRQDIFHEKATAMLLKTGMSTYPRTASEVIRHFYSHGNCPAPAWLDRNHLYEVASIRACAQNRSKDT